MTSFWDQSQDLIHLIADHGNWGDVAAMSNVYNMDTYITRRFPDITNLRGSWYLRVLFDNEPFAWSDIVCECGVPDPTNHFEKHGLCARCTMRTQCMFCARTNNAVMSIPRYQIRVSVKSSFGMHVVTQRKVDSPDYHLVNPRAARMIKLYTARDLVCRYNPVHSNGVCCKPPVCNACGARCSPHLKHRTSAHGTPARYLCNLCFRAGGHVESYPMYILRYRIITETDMIVRNLEYRTTIPPNTFSHTVPQLMMLCTNDEPDEPLAECEPHVIFQQYSVENGPLEKIMSHNLEDHVRETRAHARRTPRTS